MKPFTSTKVQAGLVREKNPIGSSYLEPELTFFLILSKLIIRIDCGKTETNLNSSPFFSEAGLPRCPVGSDNHFELLKCGV